MQFNITTMTCGHCVKAVTEAVHTVDPRAIVEVDLDTHQLDVETTESRAAVATALTEAGYPPD
jgi:copper chaperone